MKNTRPLEYKNIAVFRALKLGDMLCCIPALRAIRRSCRRAKITLIGLPWALAFVRHFSHLIDDFIEFPGFPGLPEREFDAGNFYQFLAAAHGKRFDLALQMHGSGEHVNDLIHLLGAGTTAGFYVQGAWRPPKGYWMEYPFHQPEIWKHLRLVKEIGFTLHGTELEFPLFFCDMLRVRGLLSLHKLIAGRYACIHPGALSTNPWSASYFAQMASFLCGLGLPVVLTGSREERPLCEAIRKQSSGKVMSFAGETDLGLLAALISHSRLLLCNDTGVSHIAAARRIPSVVVCNRPDIEHAWPPLNRQLHRFLIGIDGVSLESMQRETKDLLRYTARFCRYQQDGVSIFPAETTSRRQRAVGCRASGEEEAYG